MEHACSKLNQREANEHRVEVKNTLKKAQLLRVNINREEMKAIKEYREDNTRVMLTADKGVALVVMDKDDYMKKTEDLLNNPIYKLIPAAPTTRQKKKSMNMIKHQGRRGYQ